MDLGPSRSRPTGTSSIASVRSAQVLALGQAGRLRSYTRVDVTSPSRPQNLRDPRDPARACRSRLRPLHRRVLAEPPDAYRDRLRPRGGRPLGGRDRGLSKPPLRAALAGPSPVCPQCSYRRLPPPLLYPSCSSLLTHLL